MTAGAAVFNAVQPNSIEIAIDRGGTFTDVWAKVPGRQDLVIKLLSVNPESYDDAPAEGKSNPREQSQPLIIFHMSILFSLTRIRNSTGT